MDVAKRTRRTWKPDLSQETPAKIDPDVNGEGENVEDTEVPKKNVEEDAPVTDAPIIEEKPTEGNPKETVEEKVEELVTDKNKSKKRKIAEEVKLSEESTTEENFVPDGKDAPIAEATSKPEKSEKDDSSANDSASELAMPPKQTFGKGKRARVPNKRYSDIPPVQSRPLKASVENGEKFDRFESESELEPTIGKDDDTASIPSVTSLKSRSNTSSPSGKRTKFVDITNPNFLKPFEHGWKRELVYRATNDTPNKRNGDVYYYTPTGKKVRSMREVAENLKNKELSMDDFTFFKEPLGLDDPEKEIIRDAKVAYKKTPLPKGTKTPKVMSPKVMSPKVATPRVVLSPKPAPTPKVVVPKVSSPKLPATPVIEKSPAASPRSRAASRNLGNIKVKLPPSKTKGTKRAKAEETSFEVEAPSPKRPANRKSVKASNKPAEVVPKAKKRGAVKANNLSSEKVEEPKSGGSYLQNLSYGYNTLLCVFQYLKVQDLLRAGCVCTMWRDIASHSSLWRTVRMKNSQVHSFDGLSNTLKKHGTVHLDLRKMLLPTNGEDIWPEFSKAISKVDTLRKIELCRCPASVVEQLAVSNQNLEVINAVAIKSESISVDPLAALKNLKELRLKATAVITLSPDITALKELTNLTHLSLTSIKELNKMDLSVIAELTLLESLELGECADFPKNFNQILIKLMNLEKLRLEKGQGNCHTFEILEAVKNMPQLEQLELVNFDIKSGFDLALGGCSNIKKLLIIPTYISQSATTNHMVLGGVLRLQNTLSHFVWGVTLELLRVTELFVDQCEDPDKKNKKEKKLAGNGDSIPVLKPVPLITDKNDEIPPAHDPPQVEILPLPNLQKLLLQSLPTTRVKILKIPFHATWRQSITDTVN